MIKLARLLLLGATLVGFAPLAAASSQDCVLNEANDGTSSTSGDDASEKVVSLAFGSYYGECAGYCITVYELRKSPIFEDVYLTGIAHSWNRSDPQFPVQSQTKIVDKCELAELQRLADFDQFQKLAPRYGCPDCADGGAFWISVTTNEGTTKKVVIDRLEDVQQALDPVTYEQFFKPFYDAVEKMRRKIIFE